MKPPPKRASFSSRKRTVTETERQEWKHDTRHDVKFSEEPESHDDTVLPAEMPAQSKENPTIPVSHTPPKKVRKAASEPLEIGSYQGIDARSAQRFKKGKTGIDGTLDLHGLSRETAYVRVMTYVQQSYDLGRRVILIITGRGNFQTDKPVAERGVLRQSLPLWLNDPAVRNLILAFDQAQIKDGGQGAFYVFIRRKRQ